MIPEALLLITYLIGLIILQYNFCHQYMIVKMIIHDSVINDRSSYLDLCQVWILAPPS